MDLDNFKNLTPTKHMHTLTTEDLLLFIYGEATPEQSITIQSALEKDWKLKEEYQSLLKEIEQLKEIQISPSKKTLDNILEYSKKNFEFVTEVL